MIKKNIDKMNFSIHSKRAIVDNKVIDATVFFAHGKIVDIQNGLATKESFELIDVENNVLMSGIIDPHVHINEPGRTDWEGFETATTAAAFGGITTLVDMPLNSSPVTVSVDALNKKIEAAKNKLNVNVGFWGGIIPNNFKEIEPLIAQGVLGFKAFLTHSGIDEFPNVTEEDLHKAMPVIAKHHLPLLVHCELSNEIQHSTFNIQNNSYEYYLNSRPKEWENAAISMMIRLCEKYNCRTHIVHLSSDESIEQIKNAKAKGLPLTVETAQHYLFFNSEEIEDGKTEYKCAPPIREKENQHNLWQALQDGVIDFVATDHSPAPPNLKETSSGNFMKAWGGISSIQFSLQALWTAALQHDCSIENMAKWLSENPAKLIGKETSKGKIAVGYDADFVAWNPEESFVVHENIIQHKHKLTPYLNRKLNGVVKQTWLNGKLIFDKGKIVEPHLGEIITT